MTEVVEFALAEGHTFPDKETLLMQIREEANLFGVWIKIVRSDSFDEDVHGCNGGTTGLKWKVTKCIAQNGR